MRKSIIIMLLLLLALLFVSCAGTTTKQLLMDESHTGKPIKNVLIIVVLDNNEIRGIFENHFRDHFNAAGIEATSTASTLSTEVGEKLDKEDIVSLVAQKGSDTVLITHVVDREESDAFSRVSGLSDIQYHGYYQYYVDIWDSAYMPTIDSDNLKFFLETRLYDVKDQSLIWAGSSQTRNPDTVGQAIGQIVSGIMQELRKNGLVPDKN